MYHTHHIIQHSSLKAYARAEKPGTHRKNRKHTKPELNSLRAIRTAKPSVCLSSSVSSTVGDYLALGFGGISDCQGAVREQPAGRGMEKRFYHGGADEQSFPGGNK